MLSVRTNRFLVLAPIWLALALLLVGTSQTVQSEDAQPLGAVRPAGQTPALVDSAADLPIFTDVTGPAGVSDYRKILTWGASWGDIDGNGWPDLYAGNHQALPGLYVNNQDGTFTNIVASTPLADLTDRHSARWGDYDNDGLQDLVIVTGGRASTGDVPMELFHNEGNLQLVDVAEQAGVSDGLARGRGVSWADYDHDGDLDYFTANQGRWEAPNRLWRNNGDGTFTDAAAEAGVADVMNVFAGGFVDYDRDGWPDIFVLGHDKSLLYRNNGNGTFSDVSPSQFADVGGNGYAWGDYDNDGDADLFVGTWERGSYDHAEAEGNEARFLGQAKGDEDGFDLQVAGDELEFQVEDIYLDCPNVTCVHIGADGHSPTTNPFVVGPEAAGMPDYTPGVSAGYYIWRDELPEWWHVRWSNPVPEPAEEPRYAGIVTATAPISAVVPVEMEPPTFAPPQLWRNNGDGTFTEVTTQAGMNTPGNYGTANWVDVDNDGWLDLYVVDRGTVPTGNGPNHLFHNSGDGTFQDVAALVGLTGTTEGSTDVSAWADYDRNGFLDLFTMNGGFGGLWPFDGGWSQMFRNEGNGNHWLQLGLVGSYSNRSGWGAVVRVTAGGRTQVLTWNDGTNGYCQDGGPLQVGLGSSTVVDLIAIDWPSGIHQELTNVPTDQRLDVVEAFPDLIRNGGFETDLSFWSLKKKTGAQATLSRDTSTAGEGVASAKVNVTVPGTSIRAIQFVQSGLELVQGKSYTLAFWAKASVKRPIGIVLRASSPPGRAYNTLKQRITTAWKRYEFTLTAGGSDANATLEFSLGQYTSAVWLDGVELTQASP